MTTGPLAGVRILEIASIAPAPFGCMLLADLGAEILRVDRLGSSDTLSGAVGPLERGRRTIAVDLKSPAAIATVIRLSRAADVFVEGFRPGVAERLGIGPEDVMVRNPRLIYGRMTGWGQTGPLADRAGHDINYVSISGALEPIGRAGEKPHAALNLVADFAGGGAFLAIGVLAALYERERSGLGQVIDAAMVDGSSTLLSFLHGMRSEGRWNGDRGTNLLDGGASFYDTYETADGKYMAVGAIEPQFYSQLLAGLGIELSTTGLGHLDDATWPSERERFTAAFLTKTRAEWTGIFADLDACVTPVLSPWEAHLHPHNVERESFFELNGVMQPAPAPRFSRSVPPLPRAVDDGGRNPSAALAAWGFAPGEIDELVGSGQVA